MLGTILVVLLILMLLGALPRWPHSRNWGYYPSSGLGLILNRTGCTPIGQGLAVEWIKCRAGRLPG
jgi:hypothetical protein